MKLIQEYSIKVIILTFTFLFIMESWILAVIQIRSRQIYNEIYEDTLTKSKDKSIVIAKKFGDFARRLVLRYVTDLKLVCKHSLLLNGKNVYNSLNTINRESNLFNINDEEKKIIFAKTENLLEKDYMKKLYNENGKFDYILKYEEEFQNISNINEIINNLLSNSHPELNTLSYYSSSKNKTEEETNAKFLISVLKTVYINRYIMKRANIDYARLIIINKDEIYIYPPEAYNNINLYEFNKIYMYPYSDCIYSSSNITQQFPLCVYNYIAKKIMNKEENYLSIFYESVHNNNIFLGLCLKMPFIKNNPNQAILMLEIDFSKFFTSLNFNNHEKFEFGMFTIGEGLIFPLIYSRNILLDDYKAIFNDTVTEKYIIDDKYTVLLSLFHYLYYNLTKVVKEHPELTVNFTEIEEEFNIIYNRIMLECEIYNFNKSIDKIVFSFNKTICQKSLLANTYECFIDQFEMIIIPIVFNINKLNEDYIEVEGNVDINFDLFIFSVISTNPKLNNNKINTILKIKLIRTIILFLFITIIILVFFILLINQISEYSLSPTNDIFNQLKKINIKSYDKNNFILKEEKVLRPNKEMSKLNNIYESMKTIFIIKQAFEIEKYLDSHNLEFYNLIQDINKINIKEICNSFLGFYHYKNNAYNLAEKEFNSTINFIIDNENKATSGKNTEYEDKIKDAIKRSSTVSYLNEFSEFEKIEENLLTIINLKIFKQRFMYLYAMTKFRLGSEINNNNNNNYNTGGNQNKNKSKNDKNKRINYFKEAIKYFNECKNINNLLGINKIKVIYSLIMISKCYMYLNDYKYAITNINEALSLFFEFSKTFKDYHSKFYNPKIMLFVENNIFQYILFTLERICCAFNKPFASNWITLKMFETSPFLLSNVHYHSGIFLQTYLERNKLKLNKSDSKFLKNTILLKEYDKARKYFSKIVQRINVKNINNRNMKLKNEKMIGDSSYSTSYKNKTDGKTEKSFLSSTFKREMATGRASTSFILKNKNRNKIITLCLSEKILEEVNGLELKDVIIKYFQKFFIMNENDKFSFIQFANNGKKTVYFKPEQLDYFLLKIQKTKNIFELTNSFISNSNSPFMELYNILYSIISNYPSNDNIDNIIIIFINSYDIRFTSIKECLSIVEELNKKNTSLFLLTYDEEIKREKINNIQSFLNGLSEGYFFQIKNYQQLKQIFMNLSTIEHQSNFFGYDFYCLDNEL